MVVTMYCFIGCKDKASTWYLNGFPDDGGSNLGQQYNVGEKPTVILYNYINRHAGTSEKQRQRNTPSHMVVIMCYCIGYKYKAEGTAVYS